MGVCCDGLAANRRLFSLHQSKGLAHKVINPHAHDGERRYLYFLSDPPHLIKTVRNCWVNYKRKLWVSLLILIVTLTVIMYYYVVQWNGHIVGSFGGALYQESITDTRPWFSPDS